MKKTIVWAITFLLLASFVLAGTVTRTVAQQTDGKYLVSLAIAPIAGQDDTLLIDEQPPTSAVITEVSNSGDATTNPGHIFWVVMTGATAGTYTYKSSITGTFSGTYMFNTDTTEKNIVTVDAPITPPQEQPPVQTTGNVIPTDSLKEVLSNTTVLILLGLLVVSFFILRGAFWKGQFSIKNIGHFIKVNKEGTIMGVIIGFIIVLMYYAGMMTFARPMFTFLNDRTMNYIVFTSLGGLIGGFLDSIVRPNI